MDGLWISFAAFDCAIEPEEVCLIQAFEFRECHRRVGRRPCSREPCSRGAATQVTKRALCAHMAAQAPRSGP